MTSSLSQWQKEFAIPIISCFVTEHLGFGVFLPISQTPLLPPSFGTIPHTEQNLDSPLEKNTVLVFRALLQKKEPSQHTTGRSSKPFFQTGKGNWETCSTLSAEVEIIVQEFLIPEHCKEHFHVPSHGSNEEHCWLSKSLFPGICSLFPTGLYYFMTLSIFHSFVQGLSGSTCRDFSPSPAAAEQPCPEQPAGTSSSWAHSTPRCQWGSCTRSTTAVGQLGEGNTAHTSLPRQLFVFISEHKPQNTWKQVTWLVYIPQTRAQCGEIPYSGFHLSHGVCKHSAHKY